MTKKILVADDSPTIQKVISITLSEEPFEIDECLNANDLFDCIDEENYSLILLDINLSEDKNGYELTKEILHKNPDSKVMLLLGTFDTISDSQFVESGAHDKMIKPFDSKKFVQSCRSLIGDLNDEYEEEYDEEEYDEEEYDEEEYDEEEYDEEEYDEEKDTEDEYEYEDDEYEEIEENAQKNHENWIVKGSSRNIENKNDASLAISRLEENAQKLKLEKELDEWGGDLPSVIKDSENSSKNRIPLPPQINELNSFGSSEVAESKNGDLFPDDDDLGYPGDKDKGDLEPIDEPRAAQRFLSADELMNNDDEDEEEATDPSYILPENFSNDLEKEVDADISPDDFWAVDSKDEISNTNKVQDSINGFQGKEEFDEEVKKQGIVENQNSHNISIEELKPLIEEVVKKYCESTVTKVAWEVIPDLAENLIREELKEISQKIN